MCKDKPMTDILHIPGHSDMCNVSYPVRKKAFKKFQSNAKKRRFAATNAEKIPHPKNRIKKDDQNVTSQILLLKQH